MVISNVQWYREITLAIGITLLALLSFAGGANAVPIEEWNKTFGGTGNDVAKSIQQTPDGGYILGGYKFTSGKGYEAWLIKTDADSNEQWDWTFGGTVTPGSTYYAQHTSDGGYVFLTPGNLLIKTDTQGIQEWNRTFGKKGSDELHSVQETADGSFVLSGKINLRRPSGGILDNDDDVWLLKISPDGDIKWNRTFGRTYTGKIVQPQGTYVANSNDESYFVQQTKDGGYILAAKTQSTVGEDLTLVDNVWIIKTDSDGKEQWNKILDEPNLAERIYFAKQTSDGGYIFPGYIEIRTENRDAWLIKTDEFGIRQWSKTFGGTRMDEANSILQTKDGSYILAGYSGSYGAGKNDAWLVRADEKGNELWNKTFGGAGEEQAYSIQQTTDGGYLLAGSTSSYGAGSIDAWLMKLKGEPSENIIVPSPSPTARIETTPVLASSPTEVVEPMKSPSVVSTEKVAGFQLGLVLLAFSAIYIFMQKRR